MLVGVGFGGGGADGGSGVVEELILESERHVGDGFAVGFCQVGEAGEEFAQLSEANGVCGVAEFSEYVAGGVLVA